MKELWIEVLIGTRKGVKVRRQQRSEVVKEIMKEEDHERVRKLITKECSVDS